MLVSGGRLAQRLADGRRLTASLYDGTFGNSHAATYRRRAQAHRYRRPAYGTDHVRNSSSQNSTMRSEAFTVQALDRAMVMSANPSNDLFWNAHPSMEPTYGFLSSRISRKLIKITKPKREDCERVLKSTDSLLLKTEARIHQDHRIGQDVDLGSSYRP